MLERVDDIHDGDDLTMRVLGVGDIITDDVLKSLEDIGGLLIDEPTDLLDSTVSDMANGGLDDGLDVVWRTLWWHFALVNGGLREVWCSGEKGEK